MCNRRGPTCHSRCSSPTSHPDWCCQTVRQKLSTDMSILLYLFQISVLSSERTFSLQYGRGRWFFSPSPVSASIALITGASARIIERLRFLPRWFVLRWVAFVNRRTSYVVRGSSRHDDSPRVGASLGRLTHASTNPIKTRQPAPTQAAAICKPQHIAQLSPSPWTVTESADPKR